MSSDNFNSSESRRGFIRINLKPTTRVTFSRDRSYPGLDLTVYGISFLARPEETLLFQTGSICHELSFTLSGREITVGTAKVAYVQPGFGALCKVAIEFVDIPVEDVFFISKYIADKQGLSRTRQVRVALNISGTKKKAKKSAAKKVAPSKKKTKVKAPIKTKVKTKVKVKAKPKAKAKASKKKSTRRR